MSSSQSMPSIRSLVSAAGLALAATSVACSGQGVSLRGPSGIVGLIVFIFVIWALIEIIQSGKPTGTKVLWALLVLFVPVIGVILWFLLGRK